MDPTAGRHGKRGRAGGRFPDGIQRLEAIYKRLETEQAAADLVSYVKFRFLSADYAYSQADRATDYAKVQQKWMADLEQFVTDFPTTRVAADAMLSAGRCAEEFAGKTRKRSTGIRASRPSSPMRR